MFNADDVHGHVFSIDSIVRLQHPTPLWRVLATDMNAYSCNSKTMIQTLEHAKTDRRKVKAGIARDPDKRDWIVSLAVTDEVADE